MMNVPDMEKPRITEIKVRMDCNGCVQKIKKALHGITGIYDVYIDFPQQKVTVIGWADVEKLVRAIKKTRKTAVICSHIEQPPPEQQAATDPPPPEGGNPPPQPPENNNAEPPPPPQTEAAPPPEAQNEPPHQENPPPPESGNGTKDQPSPAEEIHVIHHHPPDYGYRYAYGYGHHNPQRGHGANFDASDRVRNVQQGHSGHFSVHPGGGSEFRGESSYQLPPSQTGYVTTHSYNMHKPSPYVTEYAYPRPSSPPRYSYYSRPDHHYVNQDYYYYSANNVPSGNGNITSMFSDENPNACTIV